MLRLQEAPRWLQSFAAEAQAVGRREVVSIGSSERPVRLVAVSVCAG